MQKTPARIGVACGREDMVSHRLEDQLRSELEFSGIECRLDLAEVAGANVRADATVVVVTFELRVVPGVEALRPKFEAAASALADYEALKEREVPIVATRATNSTEGQIAIAIGARGTNWRRKRSGVEPRCDRFGVGDRPSQVWPVPRVWNHAGGIRTIDADIQWRT